MLDHPGSAIVGISSVFKFRLDPIYSFGDIAIFIFSHFGLKLPIHAHFWGFLGHIPPNMVIHRSDPQKDHSCAETRRLSHKAWKSVQRFDLGAGSRKKVRTGQDSQKSHKVVTFCLFGKNPPPYRLKPCMVGHLADVITNAKFQDDIFRGYDFTGVEFPIFLLIFLHGPYN